MKVYIGPYPDRLVCNIHNRYMNKKYGYCNWENNQTKYEYILECIQDKVQSFYNIFNFYFDRRKQKVKIKIDRWDTWDMGYTLTLIIIPMLKQLQATKQGSPFVDYEDVPEHLLPSEEEKNDLLEGKIDSKLHERWSWILNEIIWAFEQLRDDNWQDQYIKFKDSDNLLNYELEHNDENGYNNHSERINNGLRLFGKYYTNLWD